MKPFSRLSISVVVVSLFLTLPAILLIPMSLSSGSTFQLPPPGWSTQWYENLVTERDRLLSAIRELEPPRRGRPKKNQ